MAEPSKDLVALARLHGIYPSYVDLRGKRVRASDETLAALVGAASGLGLPHDLEAAVAARIEMLTRFPLPRLFVCWDDRVHHVPIWLEADSTGEITTTLTLEGGDADEARRSLADWPVLRRQLRGGRPFELRRLSLPSELPHGYHSLRVERRDRSWTSSIISAPAQAFRPMAEGTRTWGVFVPLYAVRGPRSNGTGTFGDLGRLAEITGLEGGGVVATLPLLAAYLDEPYEPSPYVPASRLFWNELFLEIEAIPELEHVPLARERFRDPDRQHRFAALRAADHTNPREQMSAMRPVLSALSKSFFSNDSARREAFEEFRRAHPHLEPYAEFRAVVDRRRTAPHAWPAPLRDGVVTPRDFDPDDRDVHLYVQWLASEQLGNAAARARRNGPGLYLDLPVGVHPDGFDVWHEQDTYTRAISVGAPPDPLAPQGQDWGFPALRPDALLAGGARHVVDFVRHHMEHAGVLRIDHIMGLERLFWIPRGMKPKDGAYVRYPREAMFAIACLESQRARTIVVGEDLGTVPAGLRERMNRRAFLHLHVLQPELSSNAGHALGGASPSAVASLNTHDMPHFAAFLEAGDIDAWASLGVLTKDRERDARRERDTVRRTLEDELSRRGLAGASPPEGDILRGTLLALASGEAAIVIVTLEDLWGEKRAQNIPGTSSEHENWTRKATRSLADLAADESIRALFAAIDRARRGGAPRVIAQDDAPLPPLAAVNFTPEDDYLFREGNHFRLYEKLGAHPAENGGTRGVSFAVWAPNARSATVFGSFNGWSKTDAPMTTSGETGIWQRFVPGAKTGDAYKFHLLSRHGGKDGDKADPLAFASEVPPRTASIVASPSLAWGDEEWMATRAARQSRSAPISIYEVHLGSWRRSHDRPLTYRELAEVLPSYVKRLGFTHVELLPVMEHPFSGSWGYQTTGYFAPTSRFGPPQDFLALVDRLHGEGIGVIVDWVPSHFPSDGHGLAYFDGTFLYEHADPRKGFHPDWKSHIFNYGRHEVRAFLISSALYWLDRCHVDGIRVDAVASMLYLDYSRKEGEWIPNERGGRENLEAIAFVRRLNEAIEKHHPGVLRIAEESTAWPGVSKPIPWGGLGFDYKWDMGWMHDTLKYFELDPIHRRHHHDEITFRMLYATTENFVLALSHDEVVHGKRSLLSKMPGDWWQKFANLRVLYGYMFGMTGKKLLFMGNELGQWTEWNHDASLDWALEREPMHAGLQRWVADLNAAYRRLPALHELDCGDGGFEWIDCHDRDQSTLTFLRKSTGERDLVIVACNFTPVPRHGFRLGVPRVGTWRVVLNGDDRAYGGSGTALPERLSAQAMGAHGRSHSVTLTLPPLAAVLLRWEPDAA